MKQRRQIISKIYLGIFCVCICLCTSLPGQELSKTDQNKIKEIISSMTLEEKATLVVGSRATGARGGDGATSVASTERMVQGAAGTTAGIPRLGISPMVLADGPAGLRISPTRTNDSNTYYCTHFPIATLLASTWDTELVQRVGQAVGGEILEYGVDILLAPALNLHRNPLCGRNFEYYSEDPLVAGKMTAAMVKGVQSKGVGTSIKHFAANNQETNRQSIDTIVSERALRELYLEGFRIAVEEAQPWTVMSSYNRLNGLYTSHSTDLLTKILREDWGFKGFVMTDWGGGNDPVAQMQAGNELLMPGSPQQSSTILAAVKEGRLEEKILDRNVERILTVMMQTPRYKKYNFSNKPDLKANAQVARQVGAEGMVLLKNTGSALPFASTVKNVAAFGNTSYQIIRGGTGSGSVNAAYSVSMIEGLTNGGYTTNKELQDAYTAYLAQASPAAGGAGGRGGGMGGMFGGGTPTPEMEVKADMAVKAAADTDIAIITIGRNSGEFSDRQKDGDFYLTDSEKTIIQTVSKAFKDKNKKAVVILNIGGVIETATWRDNPDAILLAWQPGQEAGNTIVDVLSGKVNPSGKLVDSFPITYDDVPSAKNFPGTVAAATPAAAASNTTVTVIPAAAGGGRGGMGGGMGGRGGGGPSQVVYEEDIYVGYRYYNSFNKPVAYEFGYGLSYTQFDYSNLKLSSKSFKDKLVVTVDVKNTGKVAGREAVQIYLSAPAKKLNKPSEELAAFGKTRLLTPGESQTLSFELNPMDLASFDTASSSWVAEAGEYTVKAAASSKDIKQRAAFTLDSELMVKKVTKALAPQIGINTMRP
jgi:beta-glucosidase